MPTWHEVWAARKLGADRELTLAVLMAADGLDTGFGTVSEAPWQTFVKHVAGTLGVTSGSSIFEVGCGAGAFLYELHRAGCQVSGIDASVTQIEFIRRAMPEGRWMVEDADRFDTGESADFVVATGVFQYFPSLSYVSEVVRRMALKARRGIAVLDIPDAAKREANLAFRRGSMAPEEYARRYEGLEHLYLEKGWLEALCPQFGLKRWQIEDQAIDGYGNSAFRFNFFAWKDGGA